MLRALLYGLAILHLGPGLAFAVLAFGCDPSRPILGAVCQGSTLAVFLGLTMVFWLLLGAGTAVMLLLRRRAAKGVPLSQG
jgi:hypothetical protein